MKGLLTLVVLAAISAGVFVLSGMRGASEDESILHVAEEVALTVKTAEPTREKIIRLVQAPGDVEPVLEVEISSEIVSKIEEMPVEEGDLVKRGDLLCRLDDDNVLADLESARARIAQLRAAINVAKPDLEKAQRDVDRQKRLAESDATSQAEMLDYLTLYKKAKAGLEMREHELTQSEAAEKRLLEELKRTVIESPIDGVVSKLNAKQGEVVVTGTMNNAGTVIMTISDLSEMQVRARVDEVDVPRVKPGQTARLYLQSAPDVPVPAEVVRVASKGTRLTGRDVVTFETLLRVQSNDEGIKPGMTANVEIEVAYREDAITIPVEAVVHRMRKDLSEEIVKAFDDRQQQVDLSERARQAQYIKVVYVMEDDVARVRLVEPGIADTRRVELRAGVGMGDEVIIGPYRSLDQLEDGKKVALSDEDKKKSEEKSGEQESETEKLADENEDEPASDDDEALAKSSGS